jgi:hemoglobin/transferrin/lactoferrin receptor protein
MFVRIVEVHFSSKNCKRIMQKYILCCCLLVVAAFLHAQESDSALQVVSLRETIISANRASQSRNAVAQQTAILKRSQIELLNPQNTGDLLRSSGALFVQQSQMGGNSPVIRGFEASRVLLVVDGVRMNNAIYRAGHLQNVGTIDANVLERTEVLFGPATTNYGTDALGGAICFFTKDPVLAEGDNRFNATGSAFFRYGSVNNEKTSHADISLGGRKWGSLTSFTYSDFSDLRMGTRRDSLFGLRPFYVRRFNGKDSLVPNDDPYIQRFSGYHQYDILQKLVFLPNQLVQHTLNIQYSTSGNIPRYDRLTDPGAGGRGLRFAEWYYGPQERLMAAYQFRAKSQGWFNSGVTITASYQAIEESRFTRRFGNDNLDGRIERVDVLGVTAQGIRQLGKHAFRLGLDAQHNIVASTARRTNIATGAVTGLSTRYPDGGSTMTTAAAFVSHSWSPASDQWVFSEAFRVGWAGLQATFTDKTFFPFPFDKASQSSPTASGSLGAVWNGNRGWRVAVNAASGFRMPNVDDLGRVFDSAPGNLIVPNPDIRPEKTYNTDLNVSKTIARRLRVEGTVWGTLFREAIIAAPFQLNGRDSVVFDGRLSRVTANQNAQNARLWGLHTSVGADVTAFLAAYISGAWTHGRVIQEGSDIPLDHIPPFYGRVGVRYHTSKVTGEVFLLFNGKKDIADFSPNGEDNAQYAPADGMPAWQTLNLRAGYTPIQYLTIQAGMDNAFDQQYRNFASGINGPGRNIFVTARVRF